MHEKKEFKDFTPTQILDEVLEFIYNQPEPLEEFDITVGLQKTRKIFIASELNTVLSKLHKDEYLSYKTILASHGSSDKILHYITWEGKLYHLTGGYNQLFAEKERLKNLEYKQELQRKQLLRLNQIISFGTFVAAIYYLIELMKYFKILPCKF